MYYLYPYGEKSVIVEEFGEGYFNDIKTLLGVGKVKLFNDLYVISKGKLRLLSYHRPLSDWMRCNCRYDVDEIYDGFGLNRGEVVEFILDNLDDDTLGESYADSIFTAENPVKKIAELVVKFSEELLEIKLKTMREECEKYIKELKNKLSKLEIADEECEKYIKGLKDKMNGGNWDEIY